MHGFPLCCWLTAAAPVGLLCAGMHIGAMADVLHLQAVAVTWVEAAMTMEWAAGLTLVVAASSWASGWDADPACPAKGGPAGHCGSA